MTSAVATLPRVPACSFGAPSIGDVRRALSRIGIIACAIGAAALLIGTVTMAAAYIVAAVFATNPHLQARAPTQIAAVTRARPHRRLSGMPDLAALAPARPSAPIAAAASATVVAEAAPIDTPPLPLPAPVAPPHPSLPALPPAQPVEHADAIPLPTPRPLRPWRKDVERVIAAAVERTAPQPGAALPQPRAAPQSAPRPVATAVAPTPPSRPAHQKAPGAERLALAAPKPPAELERPALPPPVRNVPDVDPHTAIYDIAAHTVYMPDGQKLEAHSGLGPLLDNPRFVNRKGRGPTPPNVYDLTLRQPLFHGVQAIRLNPVDDHKMFGRDGILAHTYMLGPSGQSFGCVSFRDYQKFLHAFLRGEVKRLVVVPHLETRPWSSAHAARREGDDS